VTRRRAAALAAAAVVAALLGHGARAGAADGPGDIPGDIPGWRATRWGMTQAEIDRLFGPDLVRPPRPIELYRARVEATLPAHDVAGIAFTVAFHLAEADGRLQQVVLERRGGRTGPGEHKAIVEALSAAHGPPDLVCRRGGDPPALDIVWRRATTTLHAIRFGDAGQTLESDPLAEMTRPPWEPRRRHPTTGAQARLMLRYHPTLRADLFGDPAACAKAIH